MPIDTIPDRPPTEQVVLQAENSRDDLGIVGIDTLNCLAIPGDNYHYRCSYALIRSRGSRESRAAYFRPLTDGRWLITESALPGRPPTLSDVLLAERRGRTRQSSPLPILRDTGFQNLRCTRTRTSVGYVCDYDRHEIGRHYPLRSLLRQEQDGTWRLRRLTAPRANNGR